MNKYCKTCGIVKDISEFNKRKDQKDGHASECRQCDSTRQKMYRKKDPDRYKNYTREGYWKHRDKRLASRTTEERRVLWDNWKKNNPEKYKANCAKQRTKKKCIVRSNLSRRIRHGLIGGVKSKKTEEYIGIKIDDFIKYLENMFEDWMSWDNYKHEYWHIDHIIPCDYYDMENEEDIKKCFNYRNMRPLASYENFRKGSELDMQLVESYNIFDLLPTNSKITNG